SQLHEMFRSIEHMAEDLQSLVMTAGKTQPAPALTQSDDTETRTIVVAEGTMNRLKSLCEQAISLSMALSENDSLDGWISDTAALSGGKVCDVVGALEELSRTKTGGLQEAT